MELENMSPKNSIQSTQLKNTTPKQAQKGRLSDPSEWTSTADKLKIDELWGNQLGSPSHTLRVAYGIEQATPLLVNELQDETFLIAANIRERNQDETAGTSVLIPGFFIYSATASEVHIIVNPINKDEIWAMLSSNPGNITTKEVEPFKFEVRNQKPQHTG